MECVLFSIDADDEWTVTVGEREEARERTTVDDGECTLRESQQASKFNKLQAGLQSAMRVKASDELLKAAVPTLAAQVAEDSTRDNRAGSDSHISDADSDHDSIMDESASDDDLLQLVASGSTPKEGRGGKAATPKRGAKQASAGKQSPSHINSARSSGQRPPANIPRSARAVGSGKASEAAVVKSKSSPGPDPPMDWKLYLQQSGVTDKQLEFNAKLQHISGHPHLQYIRLEGKQLVATLRTLAGEVNAINKSAIALFWKIKKRVGVQQEAIDQLSTFKDQVGARHTFLLMFTAREIDVEKGTKLLGTLRQIPDFALPPLLEAQIRQRTS